jgi:hypothetical protein
MLTFCQSYLASIRIIIKLCFGRHVKPLVAAAFAIVGTNEECRQVDG